MMRHLQAQWDEESASSRISSQIRSIRRPEGEPSLLQGVSALSIVGVFYVLLAIIL